jgi:polyisoprenoid-binding protein YceI
MMTSIRLPLLAATIAAALSVSSFAADQPAPPPPPSTDLSAIPSATYTLDPAHTSITFMISHLGFSNFTGRFDKPTGTLKLNSKKPEKSKIEVAVETASVDTNVAKLDEHLKGEQFFDAAKYPEIKFKSTKIEKLSDTTGKITGDLTLHGVTKPVTLDVTFHGGGPFMGKGVRLGFAAKTAIKRTDFGMSYFAPMLGDEVTLIIESEFAGEQKS